MNGVGSPPRGKLYGFCRALVVAFATMVAVKGYRTLLVWPLVEDRGS